MVAAAPVPAFRYVIFGRGVLAAARGFFALGVAELGSGFGSGRTELEPLSKYAFVLFLYRSFGRFVCACARGPCARGPRYVASRQHYYSQLAHLGVISGGLGRARKKTPSEMKECVQRHDLPRHRHRSNELPREPTDIAATFGIYGVARTGCMPLCRSCLARRVCGARAGVFART